MCMHDSTLECRPSISPSQIADLRLAALQMSGPKRRAFEAEMTLKYCGGAPYWPKPFWLGTPDRGAWLGRETHRVHLSWCTIGLQWTQTLGRPASAGGRSASSTRRCACATRPDVPHELNLHAPDS